MIEPKIPECLRCKGAGVFTPHRSTRPTVCSCQAGRMVCVVPSPRQEVRRA